MNIEVPVCRRAMVLLTSSARFAAKIPIAMGFSKPQCLHDQVASTGLVVKRGPEFGPVECRKDSNFSSRLLSTPLKTCVLRR
jgi:hypothetical protein